MGTEKPQKVTSFLVVRDGANPDWVAIWDTIEITVGRHETQDIEVSDAEVSRKHCAFRQKGGVFTLEDLGSALGTKVNGHPIKVHELKSGDVAEIGSLKVKFGQTPNAIKPGSQQGRNVRFASQLKGFGSKALAADESGRTMMAIDLNDSMAGAPPTLPKTVPRARAVSLDGQLEELEDQNGLSIGPPPVRNLDAALDGGLAAATGAPPLPPPVPTASASQPPHTPGTPLASRGSLPPTTPRAASGDTRVQLVLEVAGPAEQVEALIAAVGGKPIQVYPLTLFVKDPRS